MASEIVTVLGTFRNVDQANSAKQELMSAGFEPELIAIELDYTGRAGMDIQVLSVRAGQRRREAEEVLRRRGAGELATTVAMSTQESGANLAPEADRWEQDLPAARRAGEDELGAPPIDAPEADVQEQHQPADRLAVSHEAAPRAFNPERGSEADQIEQFTPLDAFSDEDEERLRERR